MLGLHTYPIDMTVTGIGGIVAGKASLVAPISISATSGAGPALSTDALVLSKLTSYAPHCSGQVSLWPHLTGLILADPDPHSIAPIHALLGADVYGYALREELRRGAIGQPTAQNTIIGWVLPGGGGPPADLANSPIRSHFLSAREPLDALMGRFWEVEEGFGTALSREDEACEAHFRSTHSRAPDGRYIVRLPFRTNGPPPIGNSRQRADRVLFALERRLARNPEIRAQYNECLRDYEARGHMTPAPEVSGKPYVYLSQHLVIQRSSATTKLGVVFNASALTSNKKSLNQLQYVGPKLQADLPLLIARWRAFKNVCCADVEQMYRQILVHCDDCDYQRIRWRYSPSDQIRSFQLRTVTFGTASAPFLAQRVLQQLADDEGADFPLAAPVVRNNVYVDDCLFGSDDPAVAKETIQSLLELLNRGGFTHRKWASNFEELLDEIDPANHGHTTEHMLRTATFLKVLGIKWCPRRGEFRPAVFHADLGKISKRVVLSTIARLYDPLGWLGAVVIRAKIFLQHLWVIESDWDEELADNLKTFWLDFYNALPTLENIAIPRWTRLSPQTALRELHGFADASTRAYAAVVYQRTRLPSGEINVTLILSKTKVAPTKQKTVPRLDLCAAALLAKTLAYVRSVPEFSSHAIHCWADSTIVLDWLTRSSISYDTFVANRVSIVHTHLSKVPWGHVRGSDNPADLGSRGIAPEALAAATVWWNGPPWLAQPESEWPSEIPPPPSDAPLELKAVILVGEGRRNPDLAFIERFSSWTRLTRVVAWILRWSPRWNRTVDATGSAVSSCEIREAVVRIVALVQAAQFPEELVRLRQLRAVRADSALASLNPFIDGRELIRVGGRLSNADLPDAARCPLVLRTHHVTRLLIEHTHEQTFQGVCR